MEGGYKYKLPLNEEGCARVQCNRGLSDKEKRQYINSNFHYPYLIPEESNKAMTKKISYVDYDYDASIFHTKEQLVSLYDELKQNVYKLHEKIVVKRSPIEGWGVFARRYIEYTISSQLIIEKVQWS